MNLQTFDCTVCVASSGEQNGNPRWSNKDVIKDTAATAALPILQFLRCADRAFMICMKFNFPGETLRCLILVVSDFKQGGISCNDINHLHLQYLELMVLQLK